jgi:hypothetical protein
MSTFVLESYKLLKSLTQRIRSFSSSKTKRFQSREEVKKLRESSKYKYSTGRNMLGIRVLLEDWIHGLEIGHVMQLNPMLAQELQSPLQVEGPSDKPSTQSGSKLHELLKDPMLEKLVLLVVSLFSIATETRLKDPSSSAAAASS